MKKLVEARKDEQESAEEKRMAIWDLGSPLYDSYELVALTHLIERHLMSLPSLGESRRIVSKRISPAFDHDDHHVVPAALLVSNMGSTRDARRVGSSSVSGFMRRKLRIMSNGIGYSRKDKPKKLIKAGHRGSCFRFVRQ